jgi:hypothetical protein
MQIGDTAGLREYLFVDTQRLGLYLDQIEGPMIYDKVPEWNVELSLTGPKASGKQARPARHRTDHEKIEALWTYLTTKKLVSPKRPRPFSGGGQHFYFEQVAATAGFIAVDGFELKIWIARDNKGVRDDRWKERCLILIQDFRGEDRYEHQVSGYSGLRLLSSELDWLAETPVASIASALNIDSWDDNLTQFDPQLSFEKAGFKFSSARNISVLYRLRACCYAKSGYRNFITTVIGYPIALWQ